MTVREYLEGRYLANWLKAAVFAVPSALCGFVTSNLMVRGVAVAVFLFSVLFASLATSRTQCPQCGRKLGMVAHQTVNMRRLVANRCPHCGLKLDAPMPVKDQ